MPDKKVTSISPDSNNDVKVIPFYLPQFHTIPENDKAWGKGFTEWTQVKKAVPLFEGHYQPKVPLNKNYFCILDEGVMESQAELAKKYGIYGFCYYHYWFKGGHKTLERPVEKMLHNPNVDIPFCLCCANHDWTKLTWDEGGKEIIAEVDYSDPEELKQHVDYLCEFFADPRYIKEDGKPFFIIFLPDAIPNPQEVIQCIRERVKENGFPGIVISAQYPSYFNFETRTCKDLPVDAYIQSQPQFGIFKYLHMHTPVKNKIKSVLHAAGLLNTVFKIKRTFSKIAGTGPAFYDYDELWQDYLDDTLTDEKFIAGAFKDYDDTPRRRNGLCFKGATPEKFREYMTRLVKKVREEYTRPYIFLNAWNEWAEGSFIEPDERYGYAWLEAIRDALNS